MSDIEARLRELGERAGSIGGTTPPASLPRRARMRRVVSVLGAVSVLVIAGVGGYLGIRNFGSPGYQLAQSDVLSLAAAATEQQGTAKATFEMSMRFEGEGMSSDVEMTGTGEMDFRANSAYMSMQLKGVPIMGAGTTEALFIDGTGYTRDSSSDPDAKWIKVDVPEGSSSSPFMALPGNQQGDPSQFVDSLRSVSGDIQDLGAESLDGVLVTHYRATIDIDRMLEEMGGASKGAFDEQIESIEFDPMDVWIDHEGLLRRMNFGAGFDGASEMPMTFEMHFSMSLHDYGVPVDITAPDPSEVSESESVIDEQMGGLTRTTTSTMDTESRMEQVFGPDGIAGPWLMVPVGERVSGMLCVSHVPANTSVVEVINESNGRAIAIVEIQGPSQRVSDDGFGCIDYFEAGDARSILEAPSNYTLRIIPGSGPDTEVELQRSENSE